MPLRTPAVTDFAVEVEGVGRFVFAKRTMRDEIRISTEYSRLTEGVETPTEWLQLVAGWISTMKVLMVEGPAEMQNMDELDPLDPDTYAKLAKAHSALRAKEDSFRRKPAQNGAAGGVGHGQEPGVLVPPQVQPAAN